MPKNSKTNGCGKMLHRKESKRFKFDYEYYIADGTGESMLHVKIFCEGAMQTDLWLDELDQKKLKEVLDA